MYQIELVKEFSKVVGIQRFFAHPLPYRLYRIESKAIGYSVHVLLKRRQVMLKKTMFDNAWLRTIVRKCSLWFFRFNEWEVRGQIPKSITKCVIVAAPHTTALDLPYMLMLAYVFRLRVFWIGKQELFFFPFKKILLWLGGIPIDRTTRSDKTVFYGTILNTATEKLHLVIAPAGTRKNLEVHKWSTGFYYIALYAKVPIVLAYLDYANRKAGIGEIFFPSGNYASDIKHLEEFYAPYLPKKKS